MLLLLGGCVGFFILLVYLTGLTGLCSSLSSVNVPSDFCTDPVSSMELKLSRCLERGGGECLGVVSRADLGLGIGVEWWEEAFGGVGLLAGDVSLLLGAGKPCLGPAGPAMDFLGLGMENKLFLFEREGEESLEGHARAVAEGCVTAEVVLFFTGPGAVDFFASSAKFFLFRINLDR